MVFGSGFPSVKTRGTYLIPLQQSDLFPECKMRAGGGVTFHVCFPLLLFSLVYTEENPKANKSGKGWLLGRTCQEILKEFPSKQQQPLLL
jgi:hypothetical protein